MIKRLLYIYILLILAFALPGWGADYYINPDCGTPGDGTTHVCDGGADGPVDEWSDLTITTGNDYRQLCGTAYNGNISISNSGTSGDYIIIGAYNADGSHEDGGNETFGQNCSGGLTKPRFYGTYDSTDLIVTPDSATSTYIEINSLKLDTAEYGIRFRSNNNKARYNYIFYVSEGIEAGCYGDNGGDSNLIEYNLIDLDDQDDETAPSGGDCFQVCGDSNTFQYNHCTGSDHGGVQHQNGTNNTTQYNYFYESSTHEDFCIGFNYNSDSNIIRFNYCKNHGQGIEIYGGDSNEIYGNVLSCNNAKHPRSDQGCIDILSYTDASYDSSNNLIYNNTIYDNDNNSNNHGIKLSAIDGGLGDVIGNKIYNNAIKKVGGECIFVVDTEGLVSGYEFYNNICDDYNQDADGHTFAEIEGSNYTATQLNSQSYAGDNYDDNPDFKNPASDEFWPTSTADGVVANAGYDLGDSYDDLLDPDITNHTASPPSVTIEAQEDQHPTWIIGAYGLEGDGTNANIQGVSFQGVSIN